MSTILAMFAGGPLATAALVTWNLRKSYQQVVGGDPKSWPWFIGAVILVLAFIIPAVLIGGAVYLSKQAKGKKGAPSFPWQSVAGIASVCVGLFLIVFPEPLTTVTGLGLVVGGATAIGVYRAG